MDNRVTVEQMIKIGQEGKTRRSVVQRGESAAGYAVTLVMHGDGCKDCEKRNTCHGCGNAVHLPAVMTCTICH